MQTLNMDFFRKINNAYNSNSQKETTLYEIRESINRTHTETIDFQPDTLVDGQPMPLIVMEPRRGGNERDRMKKIEAPPQSSFKLGSKIDCFGKVWLVTEVNYNDEVKLQGVMRLCNHVLKWQDKDLNILEEPCVCSRYKTTATGEDPGKTVSVNDTRREIFIQFNRKTASIRQQMRHYIDINVDSEFEGLIEDLKVYRLTDLDRTSYIVDGVGAFHMTYDECQKMPGDRDDLGIADYREPNTTVPPPIGIGEITFTGEPEIRRGASSFKDFRIRFLNSEGNEITDITPEWSIEPASLVHTQQVAYAVNDDGFVIGLRATDSSVVGTEFMLIARANSSTYGFIEQTVPLRIVSLW